MFPASHGIIFKTDRCFCDQELFILGTRDNPKVTVIRGLEGMTKLKVRAACDPLPSPARV